MGYQPFQKFTSLVANRPNGRPVGVANGAGQRPTTPLNPALSGLRTAPTNPLNPAPASNLTNTFSQLSGNNFSGTGNQMQMDQQKVQTLQNQMAAAQQAAPTATLLGTASRASVPTPASAPTPNIQNILQKYQMTNNPGMMPPNPFESSMPGGF